MDAPPQRADGGGSLTVTFLKGTVPGQVGTTHRVSEPLISLREYAVLAAAPRKVAARVVGPAASRPNRAGTTVTVRATPVPAVQNRADHMWVEFDDGRQQYIARGGPEAGGAEMVASGMLNDLTVMAQVDRAIDSPDYRQSRRVLGQMFLPGTTAAAAAGEARRQAAGVNKRGNPYGAERNSNSFAADVYERLSGQRVGDARTWGYQNRLQQTGPVQTREDRARTLPWLLNGIY